MDHCVGEFGQEGVSRLRTDTAGMRDCRHGPTEL
jgi:hypothetical protein